MQGNTKKLKLKLDNLSGDSQSRRTDYNTPVSYIKALDPESGEEVLAPPALAARFSNRDQNLFSQSVITPIEEENVGKNRKNNNKLSDQYIPSTSKIIEATNKGASQDCTNVSTDENTSGSQREKDDESEREIESKIVSDMYLSAQNSKEDTINYLQQETSQQSQCKCCCIL